MASRSSPVPAAACERIDALELRVTREPWALAKTHAEAIARHWQRRRAENPAFFDGEVLVLRDLARSAGGYRAHFSLERFSAFLYWREHPEADAAVLDGFCSGLVRSADGHALLGRTGGTTLNAGRLNVPGGFLDARDILTDGRIDLEASIARELAEETGLTTDELERLPGYLLSRSGRYCSLAIAYQSRLPAEALRSLMLAGLARDPERELADIVIVRAPGEIAGEDVLPHARALVELMHAGRL